MLNLRRNIVFTATAMVAAVGFSLAIPVPTASAETNNAPQNPPMGWSSWSFIRTDPTEAKIEAQALAMKKSGLVNAGYVYVNLDDYWYLNPATTVDKYGRWVADPSKFPDGIAAVAKYVHSLGEKFGIYVTPGIPVAAYNQNTPIEGTSYHARDIVSDTTDFEKNYNSDYGHKVMYYIDYNKNPAAAQAYLNSWADEFASWGVDYVKLDGVGDWDIPDIQHWSEALNQTGRPIHLELSNNLDVNNASIWQQYANGWRISGDIEAYSKTGVYPLTDWNNASSRFSLVVPWIPYAGPGGWNDLDSLEIGNGDNDGLTPDERKTIMTLWAIECAPLILGTDLTHLDSYDLSLLKNREVIQVDQSGHVAQPVSQATPSQLQQVWYSFNGDGSYTVALFNLGSSPATVTANWSDLGFSGSASVRDLWSHRDLGKYSGGFSVTLNPHASELLRVVPSGAGPRYYNIVNVNSGKYLTVSGNPHAAQAPIVQSSQNGGADQEWQLVATSDGHYQIVNRLSHQLLTIPGPVSTDGTQLIQLPDNHKTTSQEWSIKPTGTGTYTLSSPYDGEYVDVSGGSTSDGAPVIQSHSDHSTDQQWKLVLVQ